MHTLPLPAPAFSVSRRTRASQAGAAGAALLVLAAASMPAWADPAWLREFNQIACYFIFAMMWAGRPCLALSVSRPIHFNNVACRVKGD